MLTSYQESRRREVEKEDFFFETSLSLFELISFTEVKQIHTHKMSLGALVFYMPKSYLSCLTWHYHNCFRHFKLSIITSWLSHWLLVKLEMAHSNYWCTSIWCTYLKTCWKFRGLMCIMASATLRWFELV
jgi:hypothetical protein